MGESAEALAEFVVCGVLRRGTDVDQGHLREGGRARSHTPLPTPVMCTVNHVDTDNKQENARPSCCTDQPASPPLSSILRKWHARMRSLLITCLTIIVDSYMYLVRDLASNHSR